MVAFAPVWVEFAGMDNESFYVEACGAKSVRSHRDGSFILTDGHWLFTKDPAARVMEKLVTAQEHAHHVAIHATAAVLEELTGGGEPPN